MGEVESIALMALLSSLVALSIDAMLPALPQIGSEFKVQHANDVQLVISTFVFGLSIGQMIYGPLSDSLGRKPVLFAGGAVFILGSALCMFSSGFKMMLVGRIIQGFGAAGPRSMVVALIRDQYEGRAMARIMSSIMAVFIIVPALAPAIGQGIIILAGWHAIFGGLLSLMLIMMLWFGRRQPETLSPRHRRPFSLKLIFRAVADVCTNRIAMGYTIIAGFIMGAFLGYLNSAQQIFQGLYGLRAGFPIVFGILVLAFGSASLLNSRMVMRFGMERLIAVAMKILALLSVSYWVMIYWMDGYSSLWIMMVNLMLFFFCIGILFGNLNAIAMVPLGHIAGTGSAVVGALSNLIAVPISVVIGRCYNGTTLPLISGFAVLSLLSLAVIGWIHYDRRS